MNGQGASGFYTWLMLRNTLDSEIRAEIYRAFEKLNAHQRLLAAIGSGGDTLEDSEVLAVLKMWNAGQLAEG